MHPRRRIDSPPCPALLASLALITLLTSFPPLEAAPASNDRLTASSKPRSTKAVSNAPSLKVLPLPGEAFHFQGRAAFLISPPHPTKSQRLPWIWYAPTLPGLPGAEEKWMFERFLAAGIAIAGIDVGESFGSPNGRALYTAFHRELSRKRGLSSRPVLLGRSRGGLMTLSWAAENPRRVAGFAGIYPVCNLTSYPGLKRACGAYHLTEEQLSAQMEQHNPIDRLRGLARARVPLFAIHGDVDRVVPLEANSGEMKRRYEALGGTMTLVVPPGQDHNMWSGFFQCQELVDFAITCARAGGR